MNEEEVKKRIGEESWGDFLSFMYGQTVGINEDGSEDYYDCDVESFVRIRSNRLGVKKDE